VVRVAPIDGFATGAPQTVSDPTVDTVLADAAEGRDGEAAVLLLPGRAGADPVSGANAGLDAVTRSAGVATFGAPERIVPGTAYVDGASVGIDDTTGRAFATWRNVSAPIGWSVRAPIG
jgi:hypothetical protein